MPSQEEWQAIQKNDQSYDNYFWYGVKSTKIFCKPSCASRLPKKENIRIYQKPEAALAAGYRPCKRCQPLGKIVPNELWVQQIEAAISQYYTEKLTLAELAALVHGSPSYMRHIYQKYTGLTPQQKITELRLEQAAHLLITTSESVAKIAEKVGIPNTAYFIQQFKSKYDLTPLKYRGVREHE